MTSIKQPNDETSKHGPRNNTETTVHCSTSNGPPGPRMIRENGNLPADALLAYPVIQSCHAAHSTQGAQFERPTTRHRDIDAISSRGTISTTLRINGQTYTLDIEPRVSLLDALREYLGLTGSRKGCNQGACGACTVLCDGQRILSCLALAVQYEGREMTTVEGLASDGKLHPLQAAFIEHDGFQCGYCTPGQICSAVGMIQEFQNHLPSAVTSDIASENIEFTDEELRERMSGNLCRCGAYVGIREAIRQAFEEVSR